MIAVLLVLALMLTALSASLYIDAKDSERRLADGQDEIIFQLGIGLAQIQNGIVITLNETYTPMERFGMAANTQDGFDEVFLSSRSLAAMFRSSEREHEVFEILSETSGLVKNLFYDYVYVPLFDNLTTGIPLELNSTVASALWGLVPDFDEIAVAVRVVDPESLKAGVSLMDLDAIYTAALNIKDEISDL